MATDLTSNQPVQPENEIDLIEVVKKLWTKRKFIIKVTVIWACLGVLVALFSAKEFSADCTIVPQTGDKTAGGNLGGLAAMAGINFGVISEGDVLSPKIYPKILASVPFQKEIMQTEIKFEDYEHPVKLFDYFMNEDYQKFSLIGTAIKYTIGLPGLIISAIRGEEPEPEYGGGVASSLQILSKDESECMKILNDKISMNLNEKDGYITITVYMPEPLAAAQFQPTGLQFSEPVNISIPNPIPGVTFPKATMQLSYLNPDNGEWEVQAAEVTVGEANYKAPVTHFSAYAIENQVNSKVEKEVIQKDEILGQESRDNSENAKALTGIVLKYKEKTGWDYEKGRGVVEAIKEALGSSVPENTLNAMAAYLKTRMYSLMGTTSGVTETERTYNTVNVNGYTEMNYTCYAKTRKTTLSTTVVYGGSEKTISVSAIRYTGADQQYKTVTYNPTHSGGKGGSI